jgi:transposase
MQEILKEISFHVPKGRHAVIVLDQAGWHGSKKLELPNNISLLSLLSLPPYSPELNPQENVWRFLKDRYLCNSVFETSEDIINAACQAWNDFINSPDNISSVCSRSWASI